MMTSNMSFGNTTAVSCGQDAVKIPIAAGCGQDAVKIPIADMAANGSKAMLMKQLNEVSFAMDDAKLFLDTHPKSAAALAYYENMAGLRNDVLAAYESQYGPLFAEHVTKGSAWSWQTEFWPWEGGC